MKRRDEIEWVTKMIPNDFYKLNDDDRNLDESFTELLVFEAFIAHEYAMNDELSENTVIKIISNNSENLLDTAEREKGQIKAIASSVVQSVYYDKNKQNYLYIAAEMLDRIANKHAFYDGNKRTALFTSFSILNNGLNIHIDLDFDNKEYIDELLFIIDSQQKGIQSIKRIQEIEGFLNNVVLKNHK